MSGVPGRPLIVGVNLLYLRPGEVGGSEVYVREVLGHASALCEVRLVLFCSNAAAKSFANSATVRIVELSRRPFTQLSRLWAENVKLPAALKRNPVDVIWSPANFAAIALPGRMPQVVSVMDLQHRLLPDNFSALKRISREAMFRLTFLRAKKLIAISNFTRDGLIAHYQLPADKVVAILCGVAAANIPSDDEVQGAIKAHHVREPYLFYPAATTPHKGQLFLIKVFARLKKLVPRIQLVFSGQKTSFWTEVVREADRLGVGDDIKHVGFVGRPDVFRLMKGAVALPFVSRFEGFGLPLLEAMQCGTPVVAAATSAVPEVVGQGGLLLQPDDEGSWVDALAELITNPTLRRKMVAAGYANVERFSWERCATETVDVLREAAGAR